MKITPQASVPATSQSPSSANLGASGSPANVPPPKPDGVEKKTLQDPLVRLRDHLIQTSAHAAHPTTGEIATALKDVEKFTNKATIAASAVSAVPTFRAAYAQDGNKVGNHCHEAAINSGVKFIGSKAGSAIGAEIGEAAGAFVGGAFGGVGAIPGAVIGGIAGGFVGGYIGSKLAVDDFGTVNNLVGQHHG